MALYLVQHGLSRPKEEDPNRPLSDQGRKDTKRIAEVARDYRVRVKRIEYSPKDRARETAEILASFLNPEQGTAERSGIKALDDVGAVAPELMEREGLLLVSHLPFLERLAAYLITGKQEPRVIRFQNSGIVCLGRDEDTSLWSVHWTLMPNIGGKSC